jgi:hypothetical protein
MELHLFQTYKIFQSILLAFSVKTFSKVLND